MKPWYRSKTIIFNLLATVLAFVATALPQLETLMTPKVFIVFSVVVGIANVGLRFITTQPLTTDKE